MRFTRITRQDGLEIHEPLQARMLSEIDIRPGEILLCDNDDGTPYGTCGAMYATQVDPSRQITG